MQVTRALVTSSWRARFVTSGNYLEPIKSGLVGSRVRDDIMIRKRECKSGVHIRPVGKHDPIAAQRFYALQDVTMIGRSAVMNPNLGGAKTFNEFNPGLICQNPNRK